MNLRNYIFSHCVSPVSVRTFDAYSQKFVTRKVPCGKCLHCKNQHINEWTTRLYAHSLYVKNVYYITLDYAPFDDNNATACKLAAETAAAYHDLNINHSIGLHPILLCKNHLQDFFKRLRKNTEKNFQYFACGEYGCAYKGHGFGRPHFHIILFSDDTFTDEELQRAWTLNGYKIGNVDFNDLRENGSFIENATKTNKYTAKYVFAYVCKYLQKSDFNFENLATYEYHKEYFNSLQKFVANPDELFPDVREITDKKILECNWRAYCKTYGPFCVCSKRPAIGLQYFKENVCRFKEADFRLFGLSTKCEAFPRYWLRKTKENLSGFSAISSINRNITSPSRIGSILSVLREMRDSNLSIENWTSDLEFLRCKTPYCNAPEGEDNSITTYSCMSFYDHNTKLFYWFTGYDYAIRQKVRNIGFIDKGSLQISDAIRLLETGWNNLFDNCISKLEHKRLITEKELNVSIKNLFPDISENHLYDYWESKVYDIYRNELIHWNMKHKIINNTKLSF